jgi:putative hydrolase of the HAD superfamily
MITDLVFDFFGTLVHYHPGRFSAQRDEPTYRLVRAAAPDCTYEHFNAAFEAAFTQLEAAARQTSREFHMRDVGELFLASIGAPSPGAAQVDELVACYIDAWNRSVEPVENIQALMAALGRRYRLSIITNTHYPDLITRNLRRMGLEEAFALVVTSVEFGWRKPHASIFAHTLARLGIPSAQAMYVGDSYEDDYLGATRAGLDAILIDPAGRYAGQAARRVTRLAEIEALL